MFKANEEEEEEDEEEELGEVLEEKQSFHNPNNNSNSRKQLFLNGWNLTKRMAANALFQQPFGYNNNNSEFQIVLNLI